MASDEHPGDASEGEQESLTPQTGSGADWAGVTGDLPDVLREPGSRVGPYIILEQLGLGGMGVVYAAYDPKLDRKVALKVLRSAGHDESAAVGRVRLASEGRALAKVSHPNVVAVFDVGTIDAEVYVAMELVEGQTLSQWRKASARPWPEVVSMFVDIAAGVAAVHEAALVHRDVKPDNILVDAQGRPRVTDFGLARPDGDAPASLRRREQALLDANVPAARIQLTQTGARLGTPAYMASEQLKGEPASPKSDQFALCVTLWETLYGERPFGGGSWVSLVLEVSEGRIREPPAPPSGRAVPSWLRRVLERGLDPDPSARWPDMHALAAALRAGDPHRARRRWWIGLGALAAIGSVTAGLAWRRDQLRTRAEAGCAADAQAVHTTWSSQARARLRGAFASSAIDEAAKIGSSVESVFDTFAQAWAQERADVCLAALDEPSALLTRRAECLDDRLETLEGFLDWLERGDDILVSRARRSVEGLTDLDQCSDIQRLERLPPPPSDPAVRERVRILEGQLAQTLVHEHMGHYDEGLGLTRAALASARETEHGPLIATALYRVAVFHEKLGHYDDAVEHWVNAFREASLHGHDDLAAQAAGALAFVEGYQLARYQTGVRWSQLAGLLLERLGKTHTLDEARRLDTLAVLTEMQGELEEAVALHERSLALRESIVPSSHQSIGYGLANLAGVLQKQGKSADAETALLRALQIFENAFGKDNPTTMHVVNNLANLYRDQDRHPEAKVLLQRVLDSWLSQLGPHHPDVGDVYDSMGDIALAQGDLDEAQAMYATVLDIRQHNHSEGTSDAVAAAALALGELAALRGDWEAARSRLVQALRTSSGDDESNGHLRGRAHLALAEVDRSEGALQTARLHDEKAQGLFAAATPVPDGLVTRARIGLAASDDDVAGAVAVWRALVDDPSQPDAVRAEALARIVRSGPSATSADRDALESLLKACPKDAALRIRRLLTT